MLTSIMQGCSSLQVHVSHWAIVLKHKTLVTLTVPPFTYTSWPLRFKRSEDEFKLSKTSMMMPAPKRMNTKTKNGPEWHECETPVWSFEMIVNPRSETRSSKGVLLRYWPQWSSIPPPPVSSFLKSLLLSPYSTLCPTFSSPTLSPPIFCSL